jgi:hypothetical protein
MSRIRQRHGQAPSVRFAWNIRLLIIKIADVPFLYRASCCWFSFSLSLTFHISQYHYPVRKGTHLPSQHNLSSGTTSPSPKEYHHVDRVRIHVSGRWSMVMDLLFMLDNCANNHRYACGAGTSKFVGCCTSDPCSQGCAQGNIRPGGFNSTTYGKFPDGSCGSASTFYTCVASPTQTFWG